MKRYLPLSFLILLSLWVAPVAVGQSSATADEDAIRTLIAQTEDANNAGDVERWVGLFTPDAVYMPPGSPAVTTRAGLVDVAEVGFRHDAAIEIEPIEIRVAGDWAFARSHVTGTVQVAGTGEVVSVDVRQLVIYERTAEGWRIARLRRPNKTPMCHCERLEGARQPRRARRSPSPDSSKPREIATSLRSSQ